MRQTVIDCIVALPACFIVSGSGYVSAHPEAKWGFLSQFFDVNNQSVHLETTSI